MSDRPESYIGISGVVNVDQQTEIRRHFCNLGAEDLGRRALLGVKATDKTQWRDTQNKYGKDWYPVGPEFSKAIRNPRDYEFPVAQVFFDDSRLDDLHGYLLPFTEKIMMRGNGWLQGLQFDKLPWHSQDYRPFLDAIRHTYPEYQILVQCHGDAMEDLSPAEIAARLKMYDQLIDYVLFDASHGTGTQLDPEALLPYLRAAYDTTDKLGIAVAGGLSADNLQDMLVAVVDEFPDISWDAEGKLHQGPDKPSRRLDMAKVRAYIAESVQVLEGATSKGQP